MTRRIPMDNCPNLRHLGGYQSRTGGKIKDHTLFRSGTLAELTDQDLQRLEALNLAVIVDFRRKSEIANNPNRLPEGLLNCQRQLNISPGSLVEAFAHQSAEHMYSHMQQINQSLALEQRSAYSAFFDELLNLNGGGLLFHCTAGKDRTGFAAALIMMALEIPRQTILEDYLLTGQYFVAEEQAKTFMSRLQDYSVDHQITEAELLPVLSTKREYLESAFATIDAHFDSEQAYLEATFGLDRHKQQALQDKFLF